MIEKYIFELLEKNNRVIVPDFGAFLKGSGSSKNIFFNEFIKVDDGLLISFIIENEKISRNEATQEIGEFIEKAEKELSKKQKFDIAGMGVLFKDESGRIKLNVDDNVKNKITPDKPPKEKSKEKKKEKVISNSNINKKQSTMENSTPIKKEATPEKKKQKTLILILVILIPVIILIVLGYLYQDKIFGDSADKKVVKKEVVKEIDNEKSAKLLAEEEARIAAEKRAKEEVEKAAKEKVQKELEQKHQKYYLVGGVFKNDQNADDYLTELEYNGFPVAKFAKIKGLNYLCYNSFDDMSKAKNELQKIKDKGYEVWILKY